MKKYIVSFELIQRGEFLSWVEHILLAGLRTGESIDNLIITEVDNNSMNLTENEGN